MGKSTGRFLGHAIPALFFLSFAAFFLCLTVKRYRQLPLNSESYGDVHLPERNLVVLKRVGWLLIVCTSIGILVEGLSAIEEPDVSLGFFYRLTHIALYLSFCFVGCVLVFESKSKLPVDSSRAALSVTFLLQYVLWNEHGMMKPGLADQRVHILQAGVNLAAAIVFGYGFIFNPKSLAAYVLGWALMALNGVWILTAGFTTCCIDVAPTNVGAMLVLETILVATFITVGTACLSNNNRNNNAVLSKNNCGYSSVTLVATASAEAEEIDEERFCST